MSQQDHGVRFEWGAAGGRAVAAGADVAVVVDVLSFTTSLSLAVERGTVVVPQSSAVADLEVEAQQTGAVLAAPRGTPGAVTLSPASIVDHDPVPRLLLPSPNGSTVSRELAGVATTLVGACLRNARAVADWLAREHDPESTTVAVVAAGERWPDGSLRPALEDLWGAGAVLALLEDWDWPTFSPEAAMAADAYRLIEGREGGHLRACTSGVELAADGWARDVELAAEVGSSTVVPLLSDRGFVPAP